MNTYPSNASDSKLVSQQYGLSTIEREREQNKAGFFSLLSVLMFGFLLFAPQYLPSRIVLIVLGLGPAIYMTGFLRLYPNSLRDHSGSLITAIGLVAFLWLVAIGSIVAIVSGVIY